MPILKHVNTLEMLTIESLCYNIDKYFGNFMEESFSSPSIKEDEEMKKSEIQIVQPEDSERLNETKSFDKEIKICNDKNLIEYFITSLTSHADRRLHEVLFRKMANKLNSVYISHHKQKSVGQLIRSVISCFINSSLINLDFGEYKMFAEPLMFQEIFNKIKDCRSLEKLFIGRSCFGRGEYIGSLASHLKNLTNLTVLHIHYVCTPSMLLGLAETCSTIKEISLKGSRDIGDSQVDLLAPFKLETLDLRGTSFTGMGALQLLYLMPSLEWFYHCPFNCPTDTIIFESRECLFEYIRNARRQMNMQNRNLRGVVSHSDEDNCEEVNNPGKFGRSSSVLTSELEEEEHRDSPLGENLKFFWLFNPGDREMSSIRLCPKLSHLTLDFVMQDLEEEPSFESISLDHLEKLTLKAYDQSPSRFIISILETCPSLSNLSLHLNDDWFFITPVQNFVAANFQNLTELHMGGDYMGSQPLSESDSRLTSSISSLPLLGTLSLCGCITNGRLLHLLRAAPNVHSITLDGEMDALTDDAFSTAIDELLLTKLEILWINVSSGVSLSTILRLLRSSNGLRRVGRLCQMEGSSKDEYQSLLKFVRELNYNTELIWVTDQRVEKKE